MHNPETLATWDTQDEEKQNKNTTQYVLDIKQTQNNANKTCASLQLLTKLY